MTKHVLYVLVGFLTVACTDKQPATATSAAPAHAPTAPADSIASPRPPLPENIPLTAVPADQIPAALKPPGQLAEAWQWQDANGENLLIVTQTSPQRDVPIDPRARHDAAETQQVSDQGDTIAVEGYREYQQQLLARQYVRRPGQPYTELWHLRDEVRHCNADMAVALLPHTTTVTDLDRDGQTETTLLYTQECRSDVSPDGLKLILHEGTAKYALRGYTVVQFDAVPARQRQPAEPCCLDQLTKPQLQKLYDSPTADFAGRYFNETDFRQQPVFLRFARQQWQRYSVVGAAAASAK